MPKDFRKIERFLLDFVRSHDVAATDLQGEHYIGIVCIVDDPDLKRLVLSSDQSDASVISISKLAREPAEFQG